MLTFKPGKARLISLTQFAEEVVVGSIQIPKAVLKGEFVYFGDADEKLDLTWEKVNVFVRRTDESSKAVHQI